MDAIVTNYWKPHAEEAIRRSMLPIVNLLSDRSHCTMCTVDRQMIINDRPEKTIRQLSSFGGVFISTESDD